MIDAKIKTMFFDAALMRDTMHRARLKALSKAGAFVRTKAKSSIRPAPRLTGEQLNPAQRQALAVRKWAARTGRGADRKVRAPFRASKPGDPPFSRIGTLKRWILFLYDESVDDVVVGPIKLGSRARPVPGILEHGGTVRAIRQKLVRGRISKRNPLRVERIRATIAPRPFMLPALISERAKIPEAFRNSFGHGGGVII